MTREEAIHIVKTTHDWAELRDALQELVPELAESEDERIRKALLRCCDDWEKGQFGCMAKEDVSAIRAWLEKQKEQKPAEWSEYEQKLIDEAVEYIKRYAEEAVQGENSKLYVYGVAERLESLRPQPHWKPSKLQMKVLKLVADKDGACLQLLYQDLKKL